MIWNNSRMQVLYFNETEADENWSCVVRISETEIVVEYQDESTVIYNTKGRLVGMAYLRA